jgi:hypothetical protein
MTPSPTQAQIQDQLQAFLVAVLPAGIPVLEAQVNRVPETRSPSYVLYTPIRFPRLRTNVDSYSDKVFTGSIAGQTMMITAVDPRFPDAELAEGSPVFAVGLPTDTVVTAVLTGSGQVGTYSISNSATLGPLTISAGVETIEQATMWTFQLDFHGDPAADTSGDMAATVSTLFRDAFAVEQFANQVPNYGVVPLYAADPAQRPFLNDQQLVENRWVVEACVQANVVVTVPKQFADSVALTVVPLGVVPVA